MHQDHNEKAVPSKTVSCAEGTLDIPEQDVDGIRERPSMEKAEFMSQTSGDVLGTPSMDLDHATRVVDSEVAQIETRLLPSTTSPSATPPQAAGTGQSMSRADDDVLRLRPEGCLDSASVLNLEAAFLQAVDDGAQAIRLDLSDVASISNVGLQTLLKVTRTAKTTDTEFTICGLNKDASAVMRISGFDAVLPIVSEDQLSSADRRLPSDDSE